METFNLFKTNKNRARIAKLPVIILILIFAFSACKQDDELLNPDKNEPNDSRQEAT